MKATKANTPDAHTVYDGLGNRVATKINNAWEYMVYDAFGNLVVEYGFADEGGGGMKYIQQDWQGSVRTVTNSNGYVVSRTDHQVFGDTIYAGIGLRSVDQGYAGTKGTRQGYALSEDDSATGEQHTWFRKLETKAARWNSPDPYIGSMSTGDPQSFNRYSYVTNDPANLVDPSGLEAPICMIDGMRVDCSTAFMAAGHGPFRISNGEAYVFIGAALWLDGIGVWEAGAAAYTYAFNLASFMPTGIWSPTLTNPPRVTRGPREPRRVSEREPPRPTKPPCLPGTVRVGIAGNGCSRNHCRNH